MGHSGLVEALTLTVRGPVRNLSEVQPLTLEHPFCATVTYSLCFFHHNYSALADRLLIKGPSALLKARMLTLALQK